MAKRISDSAEPLKTDDSAEVESTGVTIATEKPPASVLPAQSIYLGPSIAEGGMLYPHGQIFSNGLPAKWREKAEADPDFRLLLVPFAKVPKARTELSNQQSMLSMVYKRVVDKHSAKTKETK